jgi:hypothetical protein
MGLLLLALPLLNFIATSNTEEDENTKLLITIPVLAAGALYVVASFSEKREDKPAEA